MLIDFLKPVANRKCCMLPAQCRAARALLDLTQPKLAEVAGLGLSTVVDFEKGRRAVSGAAVRSMRNALEGAGVEFTNGDAPGVRLKPAGAGKVIPGGELNSTNDT
jgi:transcriptional regulator with XRE-family HTH domain